MNCLIRCLTTSWVERSHLVKDDQTDTGQAAVEFALVLPFIILAVASLLLTAVVIRDQLAIWHGAYAGASAASLEPENIEFIRQSVITESGISQVEVRTLRNDPYITVNVSSTRTVPLLLFSWSLRTFTLRASVTIHIQDT